MKMFAKFRIRTVLTTIILSLLWSRRTWHDHAHRCATVHPI